MRRQSILRRKNNSIIMSNSFLELNLSKCQIFQQELECMLAELKSNIKFRELDQYFCNLQEHLTGQTILVQRKHCQLQRGLYILIKGKICYAWTKKAHDIAKKQQLFNNAKLGIFTFYNDPTSQDAQQSQFQSFIIEQSFSIIQCQFENCLTLEDSILLKINDKIRINTKFNDLLEERQNLIKNANISIDRNNLNDIFFANMKLHSTFKTKTYHFRQPILFSSIAIVKTGALRPLIQLDTTFQKRKKNLQFQRYAILLPGVSYEVYSTTASILVVQNNPNIVYYHSHLISARKQLKYNQNKSFKNSLVFKKSTKKNFLSLHEKRSSQSIYKSLKKWQINQRQKNLVNIAKKYQKQLIVSMQTCKLSLSFSEKHISRLKQQTKSYQKPKILFDYGKYYNNKSVRTFNCFLGQKKQTEISRQQAYNYIRQRKTQNTKNLCGYQNISRQLYNKFIKYKKQRQKQNKIAIKQKSYNLNNFIQF